MGMLNAQTTAAGAAAGTSYGEGTDIAAAAAAAALAGQRQARRQQQRQQAAGDPPSGSEDSDDDQGEAPPPPRRRPLFVEPEDVPAVVARVAPAVERERIHLPKAPEVEQWDGTKTSGFDAAEWVNRKIEVLNMHTIPPAIFAQWFRAGFKGAATFWARGAILNGMTPAECEAVFNQRWVPADMIDVARTCAARLSIRDHPTVRQLQAELLKCWNVLGQNTNDSEMSDRFKRSLGTHPLRLMLEQELARSSAHGHRMDFAEVIQYASAMERTLFQPALKPALRFNNVGLDSHCLDELDEEFAAMRPQGFAAMDDQQQGGYQGGYRGGYRGGFGRGRGRGGRARTGPSGPCDVCGGAHRIADCPEAYCYRCGAKGHTGWNCPNGRPGASAATPSA